MSTVTPVTDLIADYEQHLRELSRATDTIEHYVSILRRMEDQLPVGLAAASTDELADWIFTPGRGKTTRGHYITIVQGFTKWATDPRDPRLDFDAAALLPTIRPAKGKPKPFTDERMAAILAAGFAPFRLWYVLAGYAGLRCCEIASIRREHITQHEIWVRGKGEKERLIPTHVKVWKEVAELPAGPLCLDWDGRTQLNSRQVSNRGNRSLRMIGFPDIHMHRFRHRFASRAGAASGDLAAVQDLLGHSDPATTRRYVEVNRDRMAAAVAAIP